MSEPLISIIIPVYNGAKFLRAALDSCLRQDYRNLECWIVDDHSTDDGPKIAREYSEREPERVRLVPTQARGRSNARNTGIRLATGRYQLYLDADDLMEPGALRSLVSTAETEGAGTVIGRSLIFHDGKPELGEHPSGLPRYPGDALASAIDNFPAVSAVLLRKSGVLFDPKAEPNEIRDYFFRVFIDCEKISFIDKFVTRYRQHDSATRVTNTDFEEEPRKRAVLYASIKKTLQERKRLTPACVESLDRHLLHYLYHMHRSGIGAQAEEFFESISWDRMAGHPWFKPLGVSGFAKYLGPKQGLRAFHLINKFFGRT